ncbi:ABC transporter ATP-binding protein [Paenibacillus sp. OV219]|uniref:ABC transporter ATP-binding protein n=1 Tax=Paenibacillus sp. OV219 TaxID=1884377 RepID=UPI0008D70F1D|nr:ABC transporter ATP-binding protein [Paenibacillus sp. OV219]SEM51873.1 energy-coupling factor transport system ATP-binding protein [Paenibacillus sp. OV219]
MELYRIQDVSFAFPEQSQEALSQLNLSVNSGEFVIIAGKSGCGKSTLLRHLKTALTPHGTRSGHIRYKGRTIAEVSDREQASEIGFVQQNPDHQIVTDKVWHELAFGLESLGFNQQTIRLRVAEMASFFGIQTWFHHPVTELSGGQKQLLNLASVMAMHPSVLILDEPTSQLDPIAAIELLDTIRRINQELGTTIIMTEHRLEEALPAADRLIVLDAGRIIADDTPRAVGKLLHAVAHPMFAAMPAATQIYAAAPSYSHAEAIPPLTVKEGRQWLDNYISHASNASNASHVCLGAAAAVESASGETTPLFKRPSASPIAVQFKDVWFKYEKNGPDIIKDLSFSVRKGQFYCLVGGNGTGKSTTMSMISGIHKPYRGKVLIEGRSLSSMNARELFTKRLGVLPQSPQALFVKKTVELDLYEMLSDSKLSKEERKEAVDAVVAWAELTELVSKHPYDLSGGEQQRAALAKVMLLEPTILILDEPTKGLDGFFKVKLGKFLKDLQARGITIIMVSHDIEFCAQYGEVCAMFFDGGVIASSETSAFFSGNSFYTTAANRISRQHWRDAITIESVVQRCLSIK